MSEWISVESRLPTQEDADEQNCVLVYHLLQGVMVMGWHRVSENSYCTHWMCPPMPPKEAARMLAERDRALNPRYGTGLGI